VDGTLFHHENAASPLVGGPEIGVAVCFLALESDEEAVRCGPPGIVDDGPYPLFTFTGNQFVRYDLHEFICSHVLLL
jgi:hypothetical protein